MAARAAWSNGRSAGALLWLPGAKDSIGAATRRLACLPEDERPDDRHERAVRQGLGLELVRRSGLQPQRCGNFTGDLQRVVLLLHTDREVTFTIGY